MCRFFKYYFFIRNIRKQLNLLFNYDRMPRTNWDFVVEVVNIRKKVFKVVMLLFSMLLRSRPKFTDYITRILQLLTDIGILHILKKGTEFCGISHVES